MDVSLRQCSVLSLSLSLSAITVRSITFPVSTAELTLLLIQWNVGSSTVTTVFCFFRYGDGNSR